MQAQGPVEVEGVMAQRGVKTLGQHHLDDVPRGDVLLGPAHHVLEALLGEVGSQGRPGGRRQGLRQGHRLAQARR